MFRRPRAQRSLSGREPLATLERIRATVGEDEFRFVRTPQRPAPAGGGHDQGGLVQQDIGARMVRRPSTGSSRAGTPPTSRASFSDYSVCTTWGLKGPHLYSSTSSARNSPTPSSSAPWSADQRFRPQAILIEDRASGTQLIQELIPAGCRTRSAFRRRATRSCACMPKRRRSRTVSSGCRTRPWLADYVAELTVFPAGRHDDQVDFDLPGLAWTKVRPAAPGMLEHWRRLAGDRRPGPGWRS